eukprot:3548838-Pyramimonas_sp.AAC.2
MLVTHAPARARDTTPAVRAAISSSAASAALNPWISSARRSAGGVPATMEGMDAVSGDWFVNQYLQGGPVT